MNNICSYEEGCSLPSSSNELEVLYRQLKREVIKLATSTEAKLLCHDGKIAEMCKYIKDNLSNSIRDLLDTMITSGEIDQVIIDTITNLEPLLENLSKDMNDVKTHVFKNMKFYLPSGKDYHYGQFLCLGVTQNKTCLFDCGYSSDAKYNLNYLIGKLNGKKLDYVFISHYHGDHYGGLTSFSELYDKNTKFYIAKNPTNYYSGTELDGVLNARTSIINYLKGKGYNYTEVDSDLIITLEDEITLNIYNNSDDAYTYHLNNGTNDYNNYSMVIDAKIENKHVLLGFDAVEVAQKYLFSKGKVTKTDVLFNFHHGNTNLCDLEYMLKLNPDIVIDTLPPVNSANIDGTESYSTHPNYKYKYYSNTRNEVILNVNPYSVEVEKGDNKYTSIRNHNNLEVYLNPDYTGSESIGTKEKPFRTFNQIFEMVPKCCETLTINVSGNKMKTNQRFYNTFNKLIIKGDSSKKCEFYNFQIDNCHKVEISNIKFTENTVYLFNSDARFTDCEFDIPKTENVNITNTNVSFNGCTFKNSTRQAIISSDKSIIRLNGCEIDAPTYGVAGTSTILFIKDNKITGTKNYYRLAEDCEIIANKVGSTSERPDFGESYYCNGYTYFDSQINRLIYYDYDSPTTKWKTADGIDA